MTATISTETTNIKTLPERGQPLNVSSHAIYPDQFAFQWLHAIGTVLNVGCNTDGAKFGERGGFNVDLYPVDPLNGSTLPVDIIADARNLPENLYGRFDCVVLGEILEHMEAHDAIQTLKQAAMCLKRSGRIIVTIPHDGRPVKEQLHRYFADKGTTEMPTLTEYTEGVHLFHYRKIEREELFDWLKEAGLQKILYGQINYPWSSTVTGSGVVAVAA